MLHTRLALTSSHARLVLLQYTQACSTDTACHQSTHVGHRILLRLMSLLHSGRNMLHSAGLSNQSLSLHQRKTPSHPDHITVTFQAHMEALSFLDISAGGGCSRANLEERAIL